MVDVPIGKNEPFAPPSVCVIFTKPFVQVVEAVGVAQDAIVLVTFGNAVTVIVVGQVKTVIVVGVPLQVQSV